MSESTIGQGKANDLISRQDVLNIIDWVHYNHCFSSSEERIFNYLKGVFAECEASIIDPMKHGKWVYKGARGRFPVCECSVCGNAENADWAILGDNVNYCPNCGARMDEVP